MIGRRHVVAGLALAATAGTHALARRSEAAEPPPETTRIRLEFDPADAIRDCPLRLQEAGFIESTPQELIAEGMDWRPLRKIKRELKG